MNSSIKNPMHRMRQPMPPPHGRPIGNTLRRNRTLRGLNKYKSRRATMNKIRANRTLQRQKAIEEKAIPQKTRENITPAQRRALFKAKKLLSQTPNTKP